MRKVMLTTYDNPYSPFDNFPAWFAFDVASGYHTAEFLGRIVKDSNDLSDPDQDLEIERAIDEIVSENVLGVFKKVVKDID